MPCPSCIEAIVVEFGVVPLSLLCRDDCCFDFVPCLLCRSGCVGERSCILEVCNCKFLGGGFLCGRSCVNVVKILLCEGGDVEQWLKPQNISLCLRLIHYLSTYLSFILHCFILFISYMLDIVCVPILVNQESFI